MKKQIFNLLMTVGLLTPTMTFAESMDSKNENTDAIVKAKLSTDGGRTEKPLNDNSEECELSGESDLEKSWGYGYIPKKMNINGNDDEKAPLKDEGSQEINVKVSDTDDGKMHIGVKNKSRQTGAWRLTAKTDFDEKLGEKADGITFKSKNTLITDVYNHTQGQEYSVEKANGVELIRDDELTAFDNGALTNQSDGAELTLNKSEKEIFKGIEGIVHNGFYNTQLRNCTVNIPNTRRIQNDDFNCQITWNLAQVPGGESLDK